MSSQDTLFVKTNTRVKSGITKHKSISENEELKTSNDPSHPYKIKLSKKVRNLMFLNNFMNITKKTMESTTVHGLPRIISTELYTLKIIWIASLIASLAFCMFFVISSVFEYFEYKVVTDIKTVTEIPSNFRNLILICEFLIN